MGERHSKHLVPSSRFDRFQHLPYLVWILSYQVKGKNRLFWPSGVGSCLIIKFSISQKSFCRIAEEPRIKNNQTLHCLKTLRMHSSQGSSCYSQLESNIKIHASEITELKYILEGMVQGTDIGLGSVIDWDIINRREWNLPRDRFQICLESFMDFPREFCTVNLFKNLPFSQNKGHAPSTWNKCSPSVSLGMAYPTLAKVLTVIH